MKEDKFNMISREINHLGFGRSNVAKAKQEIEKGNLFIGNTFEEYVLIQKIKGAYYLGTYSVVSHEGTNAELPKKVVDELFDTILSEEGSDDFFYINTNDENAMKYRRDIIESILEMKARNAPKAKMTIHNIVQ